MKSVVLKREQTEKLAGRKKGKEEKGKKEEKEGESTFRPSIFFPPRKRIPAKNWKKTKLVIRAKSGLY